MSNWTRVGALNNSFLQPFTSMRELWDVALLLLGCEPVADMAPSCACSEMSNWTGVTSLGSSSPFTGLTSLAHLWEFCDCWVFCCLVFLTYMCVDLCVYESCYVSAWWWNVWALKKGLEQRDSMVLHGNFRRTFLMWRSDLIGGTRLQENQQLAQGWSAEHICAEAPG